MIGYGNDDIIIGYRANDSYFSFAQDFINGTISYSQLNKAMGYVISKPVEVEEFERKMRECH